MTVRKLATLGRVIAILGLTSSVGYASSLDDLRRDGLELIRLNACQNIWNQEIDIIIGRNGSTPYGQISDLSKIENYAEVEWFVALPDNPNKPVCGVYSIPKENDLASQISAIIRNVILQQSERSFFEASITIMGYDNFPDPRTDWNKAQHAWARAADDYARSVLKAIDYYSKTSADAEKLLNASMPNFENTDENLRKIAAPRSKDDVPTLLIGDLKTIDSFIATIKFSD